MTKNTPLEQGFTEAQLFIEGLSIMRSKEFPNAAYISDELHKSLEISRGLLEALKQCEDLLAELETGGANNPELELARRIISKAEGN